jgi:hypothetical protein
MNEFENMEITDMYFNIDSKGKDIFFSLTKKLFVTIMVTKGGAHVFN